MVYLSSFYGNEEKGIIVKSEEREREREREGGGGLDRQTNRLVDRQICERVNMIIKREER